MRLILGTDLRKEGTKQCVTLGRAKVIETLTASLCLSDRAAMNERASDRMETTESIKERKQVRVNERTNELARNNERNARGKAK